jgi:Ca2+-binding RTX toxin-like protein
MLADGNDTYTGGDGYDTLDFSAVGGVVQVNLNTLIVTGSAGTDALADRFEAVIGSAYNDALNGSLLADALEGGLGNDSINGKDGADWISGGRGNDTITLGAGNDTFKFITGDGADTITDFAAGSGLGDVIDFTGVSLVHSLADLMARASQVGAATFIDFGAGDTITLLNVDRNILAANDFTFA